MLLFSGTLNALFSQKLLLLLLLWAWFGITSILSTSNPMFMHHTADTWQHLGDVSKVLLMTVAMMVIVDSFERLRILVIVTASCFGFYVLKSLPFIILTGGAFRLYGPPQSMIADNNDFGLALNMTLPLFFFLAQAHTNPRAKLLFAFFCLSTIPASFFTYCRVAVFALLV